MLFLHNFLEFSASLIEDKLRGLVFGVDIGNTQFNFSLVKLLFKCSSFSFKLVSFAFLLLKSLEFLLLKLSFNSLNIIQSLGVRLGHPLQSSLRHLSLCHFLLRLCLLLSSDLNISQEIKSLQILRFMHSQSTISLTSRLISKVNRSSNTVRARLFSLVFEVTFKFVGELNWVTEHRNKHNKAFMLIFILELKLQMSIEDISLGFVINNGVIHCNNFLQNLDHKGSLLCI
mmetsp:Transcript_33174/g.30103  ORF Transcript_33174/g.30103 Transcript_33174/m.30103 type:complete len:230 (-) Transcript_33174:1744-2433(-)